MELQVVADVGEGASGIPSMLEGLGIDVEITRLPVGDYVLSDRCAVERKTANDFAISIGQKRLWRQLPELRESYQRAVVVIEGPSLFSPRSRMHPELVRRAVASIVCAHRLSVLTTRNPTETAELIASMAWSEQAAGRPVSLHGRKKPRTVAEQQRFLLEAIPRMGPGRARALLAAFGSVRAVVEANERELAGVAGVGPGLASLIRSLIDSPYERGGADPDEMDPAG